MNAGNRTGKTVLIAMIHIKFAYYKIGIPYGDGYANFKYRTFAMSPISRQARECLKYIEDIIEGRFTWTVKGKRYSNYQKCKLRGFYAGKNESIGELRYSNGSITYAFSTGSDQGANFQGLPAGIVTYDECVLSHHLEDELDSNIYSRLGDYGKVMMLVSTPNEEAPSQQYFHHMVQEAINGISNYIVIGGSFMENIFISLEKRESHAQTVRDRNPIMARQILEGAFVSTGGKMFDTDIIERMWIDSKMGKEPQQHHRYLISVDWGFAEDGDETVMLVFDLEGPPFEIVYAYAKTGGDPYEMIGVLNNLVHDYNEAEVIMDTASMGGTIMRRMLKRLKITRFDNTQGVDIKENALVYAKIVLTKNRKKIEMGENVIETNPDYGWVRSFYLPKLANQMATYKTDDRKLKQDWVMTFIQGCWYLWKKFGDHGTGQKKSVAMNRFRTRAPKNPVSQYS